MESSQGLQIHPLRCDIDLDWCTYRCPCGHEICTRYTGFDELIGWLKQHKSHTNGKMLEHVTEDGMRIFGDQVVPDELKGYPRTW